MKSDRLKSRLDGSTRRKSFIVNKPWHQIESMKAEFLFRENSHLPGQSVRVRSQPIYHI
jgi:hypothetical protein